MKINKDGRQALPAPQPMALKAIEPVLAIYMTMPARRTTPPAMCHIIYLNPALCVLSVAPCQMTSIDATDIISQKKYKLIRSPAKTTPSALPAYTSWDICSLLLFTCNE